MKYKEQYLIFGLNIILIFCLINVLVFTHQKDLNYDDTASINLNTIKVNNHLLNYGVIDNHPYLRLINDDANTLFELKLNALGSLNNINYNGINLQVEVVNKNLITSQDFFITNNTIIPFHNKQLTINYSKSQIIKPKYLVIHETANTAIGANASAHYKYWNTNSNANSSIHFIVDSKEIYQLLRLDQMAWHVGDNKGYSDITNNNSIGLEICVNQDGYYKLARQTAIDLTIAIMKKLNFAIDQLKIHQDASGKFDPIIMLNNNTWNDFKEKVNLGLNT